MDYNNVTTQNTTTTVLPATNTNLVDPCAYTENIEDFDIYQVSLHINEIYLWVIFAFGFPGNIFSLVTILGMKPRLKTSAYVAGLAVIDNACLLCKILFASLTRYNVSLQDEGCQTLEYLGTFTGQLANWILVAMTTERFLDITMPLKSLKMGKRHHFVFLGITTVVLLLVNIPLTLMVAYLPLADGGYSCITKPQQVSLAQTMDWVDVAVYAFVPAAVLVILSSLILRALKKSTAAMRDLSQQREMIRRRERGQRDITIMIIISCVVFILLVTPRPLLSAIVTQWPPCGDARTAASIEFIGQVFYVLSDSSHAVNFYLYFLSNGRFRRQFARMFIKSCCSCCIRLLHEIRSCLRRRRQPEQGLPGSRSVWSLTSNSLQNTQSLCLSDTETIDNSSNVQLRRVSQIQ